MGIRCNLVLFVSLFALQGILISFFNLIYSQSFLSPSIYLRYHFTPLLNDIRLQLSLSLSLALC